ncbi:MAG: flagellar hook assembly protein FlgD [Bacteriovoracaceae bacterium]
MDIGKPAQLNKFANIKMAEKQSNNQNTEIGEQLNNMAGNEQVRKGVKFVDRSKHNQLGKSDFLRLLAFQLSNQDPINPMDQKKFAAELAQYSSLEQLTGINDKFEKMDRNAAVENKYFGASFLGKEAITAGSTIMNKGDGSKTEVPFFLPKRAERLMVRIFDKKNQIVQQLNLENVPAGLNSTTWDGIRTDGIDAEKGQFRVQVLAWDESLAPFQAQTKASGTVRGVTFEDGETILKLEDGKKIYLRDVESFRLPLQNKKTEVSAPQKKNLTSKFEEIQQQ